MASADKLRKRAQRAKAKAKQNRSGKPRTAALHPLLADPLINEPFHRVLIDLDTFDFKDIEENGFNPADYDDLFRMMRYGERISLLAMCVVFLQYPVLERVLAEQTPDSAINFTMALLTTYRDIFHGEDPDKALEWMESDAFQTAYNQASAILQERNSRR